MNALDDLDLRVELGDLVQRFAEAPGESWTSQQIKDLLSALLGDAEKPGTPEKLVPLAGAKPIALILPYPVSANAYWATRIIPANREKGKPAMAITYVTKEAEAYKTAVGWKVRGAGIRQPITGRVQIDIRLYPARPQDWAKRQRQEGAAWDDTVRCIDLDNANKVLLDALKGVAIEDDKWVRRILAERMEPDADGARVVLTITPLSVEQPQAGLFGEAA